MRFRVPSTPLVLTLMTLGGALPLSGLAGGTGLDANGCNINPDKPLVRDGSVEAPAVAVCSSALAGREIVVELWQRGPDDTWTEVEETDQLVLVEEAFPRFSLGLTNISCRRLDQDRTRRFKTRIAVSDGSGYFTEKFSPVEELRRDCLAGMSDEDWAAEGDTLDDSDVSAESQRRKRWRKPPHGAIVRDLRIKCRDLKDDPKAWRKAGCPGTSGDSVGSEIDTKYGDCGSSWVDNRDAGGGFANIEIGWQSILGPITSGESLISWHNFDRGLGGHESVGWGWGRLSGSRSLHTRTGAGLVSALHTGDLFVSGYGHCAILDPYEEATITN